MSKEFADYRQRECRLWVVRWMNKGWESPEEDAALDEMEQAWIQFRDEEQDCCGESRRDAGQPSRLA